jgi:acetoin utilization deacetylase AcuC-like enzyme
MQMSELKIFTHPACVLHDMGLGHPEQPARVVEVMNALRGAQLARDDNTESAPQVVIEHLARVHPRDYIDFVFATSPKHGYAQLDPDTSMNSHSLEAALRAAGASVAAVDWVMGGEHRRAFCAVRPPGHHALPDSAMGFCIFANVAIAAQHAISAHGVERVAIVDFDVHHGNGTEACVGGDERIRLYSTFQHPYYPHSGVPSSATNVVNIPLAWGSGSEEVRAAFSGRLMPDLARFAPQVLLISAGFDAHRDDPLAGLNFEDEDYAWMTEQLVTQANVSANGRVVSMLEGGYNLDALARSAVAHTKALAA